jgi:hypothetical protein
LKYIFVLQVPSFPNRSYLLHVFSYKEQCNRNDSLFQFRCLNKCTNPILTRFPFTYITRFFAWRRCMPQSNIACVSKCEKYDEASHPHGEFFGRRYRVNITKEMSVYFSTNCTIRLPSIILIFVQIVFDQQCNTPRTFESIYMNLRTIKSYAFVSIT